MFYYTCHMLLSIITMKLLFPYSKKKKHYTSKDGTIFLHNLSAINFF
jgi:preprotein translocase subunit SecB